jgi:hypothetical protein
VPAPFFVFIRPSPLQDAAHYGWEPMETTPLMQYKVIIWWQKTAMH